MKEPISIILVGLGGYARTYVNTMLDNLDRGEFEARAFVCPFAGKDNPRAGEIKEKAIPVYSSLEELLGAGHRADLAIISSPIHLHAPQACRALEEGMHVLCEKPTAGSIQESEKMKEARDSAGRFVAIGYNMSYLDNFQKLKRDIRRGRFGRPVRLKTICLWPRGEDYYARNAWAGRLRAETGEWVLDSPVQNATAHYLHNMLYLLGEEVNTSARPVSIQAETCRARPIENYDTGSLRIRTDREVEILFYATHAGAENGGVTGHYEFERGRVDLVISGERNEIRATMENGEVIDYSPANPPGEREGKFWHCLDCVKTAQEPVCGLEASEAHLLCVNGAQESAGTPLDLPREMTRRREDENGRVFVFAEGLDNDLRRCYAENRLPSEIGLAWSRPGREIDLRGYRFFPSK